MIDISSLLDNILPTLHSNVGALIFIPLYAIWVTLLLPGVWASMLAGAIYGTWLGTILVFVGASLGAISSFLLGRTFLRSWIQKRLESFPKVQLFIKGVSKEGLKFIFLTRLSPLFPFSLLNFAYGLSEVTLRDYIIGLIAILPGTILFCGLGSLAGEAARFSEVLAGREVNDFSFLNIIGLISTLLIVWIINNVVKRTLQESDSLL